jgi:hypothetical protein
MDLLRQWLRNIRDVARDNLVVANVLLDTQPAGASLTVETDVSHDVSHSEVIDFRNQDGPNYPNREEIELILQGRIIPAIKNHRERTGFGLKESKEVVDNWRMRVGLPMGFSTAKLNPENFNPGCFPQGTM